MSKTLVAGHRRTLKLLRRAEWDARKNSKNGTRVGSQGLSLGSIGGLFGPLEKDQRTNLKSFGLGLVVGRFGP